MHKSLPFALFFNLLVALFLTVTVTSCEEDPCEDAICGACPSSRLMIQYQDSTGMCPPDFHTNAMVSGVNLATSETLPTYNFGDSCATGLLIRENYEYTITSGTYQDVIEVIDFSFQDPVEVTECCLCYPVSTLKIAINGDTSDVDFPAGQYDNNPLVIDIN